MPATLSQGNVPAASALRLGVWHDTASSTASGGGVSAFAGNDAGSDASNGGWQSEWRVKRNCSLTPRQLGWSFMAAAILSLSVSTGLWLAGAPYVLPFSLIELFLLGLAMLAYARHAADRDFIGMRSELLRVELHRAGQVARWDFNPRWVRIEPSGADGSLVRLSGQGKTVDVGHFVRAGLRYQLASELRWALRQLSRPGLD